MKENVVNTNTRPTIDLRGDCMEVFRKDLVARGYKVQGVQGDDDTILCLYHKLVFRTPISAVPRDVKFSSGFTCPPEYKIGLENLKTAMERGNDLKPYMTRNVNKFDHRDGLLDHWNIYHFHLGEDVCKDGFVTRTRHILLARIDITNVYFIQVVNHNRGSEPWYKQEMLRILHDNWPELLEDTKLPGIDSVRPTEFDDEDIKLFRRHRLATLLKIGDAFYTESGIGMLGDGIHMQDRRFADRVLVAVNKIEIEIVRDWPAIRRDAARRGFSLDANSTLSLIGIRLDKFPSKLPYLDLNYIDIIESKTGYCLRRYALKGGE